jgi:hypothetical protein
MQQRQPRLGDILDDYCPRERRVTNHAVVAMINDTVKQTRCSTCDAEHEFKHAKVPLSRRKKETTSAVFAEVLASAEQEALVPRRHEAKAVESGPDAAPDPAHPAAAVPLPTADPASASAPEPQTDHEGPVHRRLIRATLPRTDMTVPRPVPQFTMREPAPPRGHFRSKGAHRAHGGGIGGGKPHGRPGGVKPAGSRKGGFSPRPPHAHASRPGPSAHAPRSGKKHSR